MNKSKIVRPELFHLPELSGILIPEVVDQDGKLQGEWSLYIRWKDGRRESRRLESFLELSKRKVLRFHPTPGAPSASKESEWGERARAKWLKGEEIPNPVDVFKEICEMM